MMGSAPQSNSGHSLAEELQLHKEWMALALEASRFGVWEFDPQAQIIYVNEQWCDVYDIDRSTRQVSLDRMMEIIHPDDRERISAELAEFLAGDSDCFFTLRAVTPSGEMRWIEASARWIAESGTSRARCVGIASNVSEQREKDLQAIHRERLLSQLIENLPTGAVFVTGGQMQVNRAIEQMTGYTRDELQTREDWFRTLYPGEYDQVMQRYHARRAAGFNEIAQLGFRRKDGVQRDMEFAGSVVGDNEIWLMRDNTEELALTHQLNEERSRLHLATDAGRIGIWELRFDTLMMSWDRQLQRMFGLPDDAVPSWETFSSLLHPDDSRDVEGEWNSAIAQGLPLDANFRIVRPDGEVRHIQAKAQIEFAADGTPIRAVGADWDVTEERESAMALEAAKEAAETAERVKSEFLAMVSHEIRTPMNTVLGMTRLALQTELTPKQHNYLSKINSAATSLIEIISDFLDFSKMEAGKLQLEMSTFKIDTVLESVSSVLALKAEEKGLEIIYQVDQSIPGVLIGDPMRIGQILINLVSNAVKFTDHGEIIVSVARDPDQGERNGGLLFSIRDTGIGLDEGQIARIFQAFTQAGSYITRSYGGTGLGLAICKQLVELMGGRIWVESNLGQGSAFFFTVQAIYPVEAGKGNASHLLPGLSKRRVLVVDDSASARDILSIMLRGFGMEPDVAKTGLEALDLLRAGSEKDQPYDLVLMDWRMPGIDGLETARRIKADPSLRRTPAILMVTAFAREEILLRVEQLRLEGVVIKPVTESVMFNTIAEALGYANADQLGIGRRAARDLNRLRGRSILLVDDNELNREVISEFLTQVGVDVVTATSGAAAILHLESSTFDAVLLDSRMPDMDGLEATRILRRDPRFTSLPILALSANTGSDDRQASLAAGASTYLTKPIDPERLYDALLEFLPSVPSTAGLAGFHVLVVDDNALNREVLEDFLLSVGMTVMTATDGIDALEKLAVNSFDLVLMDIHMPRMDGLTATREIRKTHDRIALPVIAVTAVGQSSDRDASFAAGMNAHLAKPIDETLLFETIGRLMSGSDLMTATPSSERIDGPTLLVSESPPGIDLGVALAHLGGKHDRLMRLLRGFHRDFSDLPELLPADVEFGNFEAIELIGHTLKSSAGYLGASDLAESAAALDAAARRQNLEEVSLAAPLLIERLQTVLNGLTGLFDRIEQPAPTSVAIDSEAVSALIDEALPLVGHGDYTALTPLDKIMSHLGATPLEPLAELARSQFEELDLDASIEALNRLKSEIANA